MRMVGCFRPCRTSHPMPSSRRGTHDLMPASQDQQYLNGKVYHRQLPSLGVLAHLTLLRRLVPSKIGLRKHATIATSPP